MIGAVIIVFVLLVGIPVAFLMSMSVVAAGLGWSLKDDAEARNEGSELIALNR
jgi:flagellar biosynthesis component FlhA